MSIVIIMLILIGQCVSGQCPTPYNQNNISNQQYNSNQNNQYNSNQQNNSNQYNDQLAKNIKIINENFASHLERIKAVENNLNNLKAIEPKVINVEKNLTRIDTNLKAIDTKISSSSIDSGSKEKEIEIENRINRIEEITKTLNIDLKTFDIKSFDIKGLQSLIYLLAGGTGAGGLAIFLGQYLLRRKIKKIISSRATGSSGTSSDSNGTKIVVKEIVKEVPVVNEVIKVVKEIKEVPVIKEVVKTVYKDNNNIKDNSNDREVERPSMTYVPYEQNAFAGAYKEACVSVARKYPGYTSALEHLDSVIKQYLNANGA